MGKAMPPMPPMPVENEIVDLSDDDLFVSAQNWGVKAFTKYKEVLLDASQKGDTTFAVPMLEILDVFETKHTLAKSSPGKRSTHLMTGAIGGFALEDIARISPSSDNDSI